MELPLFYKEHLWVKVLVAMSAVFILVMSTIIILNIISENAMLKAQMKHQGEMLAESVEGSMNDSLAVGNNKAVRQQFRRLKEKMPDADIFVFDFKQVISFATNADVEGRRVESLIKDKAVAKAVVPMLENGEAPAEPFEEWINDTPYLTILRPTLNEPRCFHCHGSSRKVLGGALIRASTEKAFAAISAARNRNIVVGVVGLGIVIVFIYLVFHRLVNTRLQQVLEAVDRIGKGDLTYHRKVMRQDEISRVFLRLIDMTGNIRNMVKEILSGSETMASSSTEMSAISEQMSSGANQASGKSNSVATSSEEMSSNMTSVASAMEQTSTNVGLVATAAEQMNSTINEIAQNAQKACTITDQAVSEANSASGKIEELGKAANEIGMVTEAITEISEQTNLLALNATIEAARAGEAGKGFAVVANEIKELAKQTAGATEEIKKKIEGIQGSTAGTVSEIEEVSKVINQVNNIVTTIASAVEEQSVTTKEIAANVAQASQGIQEVTQNVAQSSDVSAEIAKDIADVNKAATEMSNSSSQVNLSAQQLSKIAEQLKEMVHKFTV